MNGTYNEQDRRPVWKQKLKPLKGYTNGNGGAKFIPEEVPGAIYSTGSALIIYDDEFGIAQVAVPKYKDDNLEIYTIATYSPGLGLIPGEALNKKNALIADNSIANMLMSDTIDNKFKSSLQYIKAGLAERFGYENNGYRNGNGGKK